MKRESLFLGLVLLCLNLSAQWDIKPRPLPDYSFLRYRNNILLYPSGDSSAMQRFYSKFDTVVRLGRGQVNILHIGGSHVQAGTFTQQFRDNLLSLGDHMIGDSYFLFPFTAGGTNNPSYYVVHATGSWNYCRNAVQREDDKRMGLAGAALSTSDSAATIQIVTRERYPSDMPPDYRFNRMTLLGYSDTGNVVPAVSFDGDTLHGVRNDDDSAYVFNLPHYTDSVCILFDSVPGEFTLTGVLLDSGKPGLSVHGAGVNGASVPSWLRCDDLQRDLRLIRPDLVIFGIGINDTFEDDFEPEQFKENYRSLIALIQEVNPNCALLFLTNNDSYCRLSAGRKKVYKVNTKGEVAERVFMELGKEYNAAVWNQFDIMGGLSSMCQWEEAGLAMRDKVHFTREGYNLMGDLLYNAFVGGYRQYLKEKAKK